MFANNRNDEMVVGSNLGMTSQASMAMKRKSHYAMECVGPDGQLKWRDEFDNLVTTAGLNDSLQQHFKGSAYTALWYVGLTAGSTYAASDIMSSHAGWTESTVFSNASRPVLTLGSVAAGSVDNSASKAVFNINATGNIFGAFVTTGSVVGTSGSTGTLYGEGNLAGGMRAVQSGDTLSVTITLTAS
jgi:hypothetical protein